MVVGPCNWVVAAKNRQGMDMVEWSILPNLAATVAIETELEDELHEGN